MLPEPRLSDSANQWGSVAVNAFLAVCIVVLLAFLPAAPKANYALAWGLTGVAIGLVIGGVTYLFGKTSKILLFSALVALLICMNLLLALTDYYIGTAMNFGHRLTKTDALYFQVSTFTTVGYGDIVPVSQKARALVTVHQLIGATFVLGIITSFTARLTSKPSILIPALRRPSVRASPAPEQASPEER